MSQKSLQRYNSVQIARCSAELHLLNLRECRRYHASDGKDATLAVACAAIVG